jgi:hypothetical protein
MEVTKKNIILIDLNCSLFDSILLSNEINIHTIIVSSEKQKDELLLNHNNQNILTVETIQDFYQTCKYNLDYKLIEKYKMTQVKVENWFGRVTTDINAVQYLYANALSYWNNIFLNNQIDAVIYEGHEYGSNFDSIIFDIAKEYNSNVYLIELVLVNGSDLYGFSVFNYLTKEYIYLNKKDFDLNDININDYLYYQITPKEERIITFKEYLTQYPEKYGGFVLIMFIATLFGKYKGILHSFKISWFTYFRNYIFSKRLYSYYQSKSVKLDNKKKYVFYALHMEPEAATIARTTFANQLVIIKALSQELPKGWTLYVKEHPHQFFKLNNFERYYFLASIDKFKTKRYYAEIVKLKNVELLDINTSSKEIIKYAQAISTINGTITLEAIVMKKPILLFSQNTTPFMNLKDIFNIANSDDIKEAFDIIKQDRYLEYQDFDKLIDNYFFEAEFGKKNDYKKLIEYLILKDKND